jgi:hypothetical protein
MGTKSRSEAAGGLSGSQFALPDQAQRLEVAYQYESLGEGPCIIDLGLRDEKRVRGWSGGARTEFFIEMTSATPGYLPGALVEGVWAVLLGAYRVPAEGCIVKVKVTVKKASGGWLLGDLHSHTFHSDGTYSLEDAVAIMKEAGCDFLATTDHNTVSQNFAHPQGSGLVMIPGMELTTYFGHSNFLGVPEPVKDFRVTCKNDVMDRLKEAKGNGALRVINHPYCDYCAWEWGMDADAEAVEIWNGPWRPANQRALNWWQEQLESGRRIPAVGGSDTHRPDPYVKHAWPSTWVYAQARTKEAILAGISAGRVYMSFAPFGPRLQLQSGKYCIGDKVPASEATNRVSIQLENVLPNDVIRFITDKGQSDEWVVADSNASTWSIAWERRDYHFMRVEVWRFFQEFNAVCPALLSNPIFFESY